MDIGAESRALLQTPELAKLGPGPRTGRKSFPELDSALRPLLDKAGLSKERHSLVLAVVLLRHDHLDEAHSLAQNVPTADGSFVHGIMHRREPDYGNARYWFHRVGAHPAFPAIAQEVSAIAAEGAGSNLLKRLCRDQKWDPFGFIDCCQEYCNSGSAEELFLRKAQKAEFSVLLARLAAG